MEEKDELQKEIESLKQTKAALETEISQVNTSLAELNATIASQTTVRDNLNADVINLTASRNNLNNEIATNTSTRDNLQSEITKLVNSKGELEAQLAGTTNSKQTLETEITNRNQTIVQLDAEIETRINTRNNLNTEIANLTNTQTEISNSIAANTPIKKGFEDDINVLKTNRNSLNLEIENLQKDKTKWEENVKQWRDKYDLFSNDIAGISENNLSQRNKYAFGIGLTALASIIFMFILVCSVKSGSEIPEGIKTVLTGNPRLLFMVYVLMRISIVGSLFVLIFVFINLLRGFVSQYIRTQEKMSSIRLIDFLASKIGKETKNLTEGEKLPFETAKMEKQNALLSKHLPDLMENNPSSFDKLSKTKSPDEILQDLVKSEKIVLPNKNMPN
jgi:predicted  nucleic acid-binding Zn-ribbon protein